MNKWEQKSWKTLSSKEVIRLVPTMLEISLFGLKGATQNNKGNLTVIKYDNSTLSANCPDFELSKCLSILEAKNRVEKGDFA